ncbi:hypothetical protein [Nonomuraea basaltis]|uniref:hypothetical protein n=1 Tax=Nonomuraea basaltis TaxID=2495887 RepID=UPI00110C5CCC|nr:hypothetical protein [Nonomuraea basaltis]TMR92133.1 hypothetical protein EJK15_46445 [Nonomuraea basaltis]
MHRSVRLLLSLAAASAAVVAGIASPVAASTADEDSWGPVYSRSYDGARAMAVGHWKLDEEHGDELTVKARLYDKKSPPWLCAYLQVNFAFYDGEKIHSAMKCGPNGFTSFARVTSSPDIPSSVSARVCYWDKKTASTKKCGTWTYLYGEAGQE